MTQKLWLQNVELAYNQLVFDIIQFGSSVIENKIANDIDIAVIYKNLSIKEQLIQSQQIKKQLEKISNLPIHIHSFDLYSFFQESNFSKEGILIYGKSLLTRKDFAKTLGFSPKLQINYNLKNLKKKDKIRFHYMLQGKGGKYGLLRTHTGSLINPGLIEIPPEYEEIFIEEIKKFSINFKIRPLLSLDFSIKRN